MVVLITLIIILHLFLSIKRPLYGFCSLLAIKILVPDNARNPFFDISLNTTCSLILLATWIVYILSNKNFKNGLRNSLFRYLLFFISFSILAIPLSSYMPISTQISPLFQFVILQLCPVIVFMSVVKNKDDLTIVLKVFLVSVLICVTYSLVCFVLKIPYPYNEMFTAQFGGRDENLSLVVEQVMGNVIGRCMGTATSGTYDYGMVISIVFTTIGCIYLKTHNKFVLIIWILCGLDVLCTTRRSPIITAMIFSFVIFLSSKKSKSRKLSYVIAGSCIILLSLYIFPQLSNFKNILESSLFFWNDSVSARNDVAGSSVSYRLFQLSYTWQCIQDNLLFGNGWGSPFYKGVHSVMNGWESIVFTTLMQFGIVGMLIWILLFYKFYRYSIAFGDKVLGAAFMLSALAFCILTDTIYHFYIFWGAVLIHKMSLYLNSEAIILDTKYERSLIR